jgi:hypothetical protein
LMVPPQFARDASASIMGSQKPEHFVESPIVDSFRVEQVSAENTLADL